MPIPDQLKGALDILNEARAKMNPPRNPFRWDDRLAKSAQELVEWAHQYKQSGGNVMADAHHDHQGRIERSGWPYDYYRKPPDARPGVGNTSECGCPSEGDDRYPEKSPEDHARNVVWMLTESNLSKDLREGHVWDFRTQWTHIGIGYKGGFFALDYGYLPGEDVTPEPTPTPQPNPKPVTYYIGE